MLPSKLFNNVGLAPVLRSVVAPRLFPRASVSVRVQARWRLGAFRPNSFIAGTSKPLEELAKPSVAPQIPDASQQVKLDPPEPHLAIAFTCTANGCDHRSAHTFTKRSYERGIVIIQCPSCKNRHLIADNLGWFKDDTEDGRLRTVEHILRARGEEVRRGKVDADGVIEFSDS
ncbi:DNL zinc finger-domain-containing protein [Melanogaster broomeanus]|nr:DNL zinc finger-domain-containing protein [Melanogaster broomeanus]